MNKRILIVDYDILNILNIILRDNGFDVVLSNVQLAASQIHVIRPDIILLDVRMNGAENTGAEICAQIKAQYPEENFPVVLVSEESNLEVPANECGADLFIRKPFDIYDLLWRVKRQLT